MESVMKPHASMVAPAVSKADSYICLCPLGFRGRHCEDGKKDAN